MQTVFPRVYYPDSVHTATRTVYGFIDVETKRHRLCDICNINTLRYYWFVLNIDSSLGGYQSSRVCSDAGPALLLGSGAG